LNSNLKEEALNYNAFTDIEFNPKKSINCQAYSLALYVSLEKRKLLQKDSIPPKDEFIKMISNFKIENTSDKPLI
ncbi:MAG: hypothetical protein L0H34_08495, partial [Psychrobacter sp.]|nr:hypothetical protein [Psychrobacter sp.]